MSTSEERTHRARLAAHTLHAVRDPHDTTAAAQAARLTKLRNAVDPDQTLDPEERDRRAHHLLRAEMARLALRSAQLRRERANAAANAALNADLDHLLQAEEVDDVR
ncbi:MAG: hypothetical protein M3Q71_11210 [Chloroflexota bacterium]|nr:hypothetical protein [Chloroflexota bacterium]